jgi:hypothetical protein
LFNAQSETALCPKSGGLVQIWVSYRAADGESPASVRQAAPRLQCRIRAGLQHHGSDGGSSAHLNCVTPQVMCTGPRWANCMTLWQSITCARTTQFRGVNWRKVPFEVTAAQHQKSMHLRATDILFTHCE